MSGNARVRVGEKYATLSVFFCQGYILWIFIIEIIFPPVHKYFFLV